MAIRLDQIQQPIRLDQIQPTDPLKPTKPVREDLGPMGDFDVLMRKYTTPSPVPDQIVGRLAEAEMSIGRAAVSAPSIAVKQVGLLNQWINAENVLNEKDPQKQAKLLKQMREEKKVFDYTSNWLAKPANLHKEGMETIMRNHPEWKSEPPESFIDLLKSPDKLAVSLAGSVPVLLNAGILTAAGQPQIAAGLMYVTEGQQAYDQAIVDNATEEEAAIAYGIYGSVAAALESMQLEGIIKVAKGSYNTILNRTVQKVAKGGLPTAAWGTIKVAAQEAVEEISQGAWQEMTAKVVYDKDVPEGVAGFIDRRAQEAYTAFFMGLIPGVAGGVAAKVQARQTSLDPQIIAEQVMERAKTEVDNSLPKEEQETRINQLIEEQITGNIQTREKIISKFPQKVTDAKSLKEVGDKIAQELGITPPKQWTFNRKFGKAAISGYNQSKGDRIHILQGNKPLHITGPRDIKWAWDNFGLQVKIGDKLYPSQALLKRAIIHELLHTPQAKEFTPSGRRRVHPASFKQAVQENVKKLFATKVVPVSEAPPLVPQTGQPLTTEQQVNAYKTTDNKVKNITEEQLDYDKSTGKLTYQGKDVILDVEASGSGMVQQQTTIPEPIEEPKKLTRRQALKQGHELPKKLGWDEATRRDFMQNLVGKSSMGSMATPEMRAVVAAMQGELKAAGLEYAAQPIPVDELISTLEETKKTTEIEPSEEMKIGAIRKLARRIKSGSYSFVVGLERMERLFESLDGHKKGAFTENIWKPVQQADELATENSNQELEEFQGQLAEQGIDVALWVGKAEQLGNTKWELTPSQKIGTYMLSLNQNGRRQLIKGMGFSESDLAQVTQSMTPKEKAVAEWLLEKYDQQWDVIKQIAAQSGMDISKLKKELHYSPIMRTDADLEMQEDFLSGLSDAFTGEIYDPEHKFLEERKPSARGKVELDAAILYMNNIARTQRFLQMAPVANRVGKILNNRKFKQALNERTYGQGSKLINKWMQDAIRGTTAQDITALAKTTNIMRRNGIIYAIGYNIPSSLRQSLSLSNAVAVDKAMLFHTPANLAKAATPKGYKEMEEFVMSRSLQVKNSSFDRDLRAKASKAGLKLKLRGKRQWSQRAVRWIRWMDRHTRVVAWKSLYDTGMGKFNDEQKAMEYADKWVARTQPMANMKDLPHFFRGGSLEKLLTTFQNQVNNNANFYVYDILGAKKAGEISLIDAGHRVMFSYVLPAILFGMIGRGGLPKDWKQVVTDLITYPIAGAVVVGRWITSMIQGWGDSSSIAEVAPSELSKLIGAVKRKDTQDIIKYAATTIGAATGRIPAQAVRTTEGAIDLATGETEDPRRLVYSEWALQQGKKKNKGKHTGVYIP